MIPALLALVTASWAGRHELSFEYGYAGADASTASRVGLQRPHAAGLRVGVSALQHPSGLGVVVLASWGRTPPIRFDDSGLGLRSTVDRWGVGLKVDGELWGFLFPYGRVEARLLHAAVVDTSGEERRRVARGLAPGGLFAGGVEFMLPDRRLDWPVTAGIYVEGGWAQYGRLDLDLLGSLDRSGPAAQIGVGLRF